VVTTTGTYPTGISANNIYYVVGVTGSTFQLAATIGGSAITPTTAGTGTITVQSPLVTVGAGGGNFGDVIEHLRLDCAAQAGQVAPILALNEIEEYSGIEHFNVKGCNSATATSPAILLQNVVNMHAWDIGCGSSGDNDCILIQPGAANFQNTESDDFARITVNNSGANSGTCGVEFGTTTFSGHASATKIHYEGFVDGICVDSGMQVALGSVDGTGNVTQVDVLVNSGGSITLQGVNDLGTGTAGGGVKLIQDATSGITETYAANLVGAGNQGYVGFYSTRNNYFGATGFAAAGAASKPGLSVTGNPYTGGSTTTNLPQLYLNQGGGTPAFSSAGTELGINPPSGFTGNDLTILAPGGGATVAKVDYLGNLTVLSCTGCATGTVTDGAGTTTAGTIPESTTSAHVLDYSSSLDNGHTTANTLTYGGSAGIAAASFHGTGTNGGYAGTEGTGASVTFGAGIDGFYPDSTSHCLHENLNNVDVGCTATASNTLTMSNKTLTAPVLGAATGTSLADTGGISSASYNYCPDTTGTGTAGVCTITPTFSGTVAAGTCITYTTTTANTGTGLTWAVNTLGAKSVSYAGSTTVAANYVKANQQVVGCYDGTNWELSKVDISVGGGGSSAESSLTGSTAATTITETGAGDAISRAGVETGNLTSGYVITDGNSTNNNTNIGLIAGATGTSTGGIGLLAFDASGTTNDIQRWYSGGSVSAGVYTVGTLEGHIDTSGNLTAASTVNTGTAPACTAGSAGGECYTEGTNITNASGAAALDANSTTHELAVATNGSANFGMLVRAQPNSVLQQTQTALISTSTLCAASAGACNVAGTYHIHMNIYMSGTACSNVTAGGVTPSLTWTDGNAVTHAAVIIPFLSQTSATAVALESSAPTVPAVATTLANQGGSADYNITTNGTVIQYAVAYTACTTGTLTYNFSAIATRIQ
jgi:hypothetical protein